MPDALKMDECEYTCSECLRSFYTRSGLQIHRLRRHTEGENDAG